MTVTGVFLPVIITPAHAEITVLDRDNDVPLLSDLEVKVGGSIRVAESNQMGHEDDGARLHRGVDDGTRFRFTTRYYLPDEWSLLGYYEVGTDMFHTLGWKRHEAKPGSDFTNRRMLYVGVSQKQLGTFTFGKQNSVFYQTVGAATDVWVQDMKGQGPGNGINGDYDGSYRARDIFLYTNSFGPLKVFASGNFADSDFHSGDFIYRRKGGGAIGATYNFAPDFKLGVAYSYNNASLRQHGMPGSSHWNQRMLGTAITYTPGNWYIAGMAGVYKNFIPVDKGSIGSKTLSRSNYFEGSAHSWEGYIGYTVNFSNAWIIESTQPYIAESAFRWNKFSETYNYIGLATRLRYGFGVYIEHQFSNTSDKQPDTTKIRLRYDF